jgi:hypothetical protein
MPSSLRSAPLTKSTPTAGVEPRMFDDVPAYLTGSLFRGRPTDMKSADLFAFTPTIEIAHECAWLRFPAIPKLEHSLIDATSGEAATDWMSASWPRLWEVLDVLRNRRDDVLPDTEIAVSADFRPAPSAVLRGRIVSVTRAQPDLGLSDADWAALRASFTDE